MVEMEVVRSDSSPEEQRRINGNRAPPATRSVKYSLARVCDRPGADESVSRIGTEVGDVTVFDDFSTNK